MSSVFMSYSSQDKVFVRRLAKDLKVHGVRVWLDEWEIKVGDEIRQKIEHGISNFEYFAVILTPAAVSSDWVQKELNAAYMKEIREKRIVVLPVLVKQCDIPTLISGKRYADFTQGYGKGLTDLLRVVGEHVTTKVLKKTKIKDMPIWWPISRGNSQRNGQSREILTPPFSIDWLVKSEHMLNSDFVADNALIFVHEPHIIDGKFDHSEVVARNITNGEEIWRRKFSDYVRSCPAIIDDTLCIVKDQSYFRAFDGAIVYGIDKFSGDEKWKVHLGGHVETDLLAFDNKVIVGSTRIGEVLCIDASTGNEYWTHELEREGLESGFSLTPFNSILFLDEDGIVCSLDSGTGKVIWKSKCFGKSGGAYNHFALSNKTAFYVHDGSVVALDSRNGVKLWESKVKEGGLCCNIAVDDMMLYCVGIEPTSDRDYEGCYDNIVFALDKENGKWVWSYPTGRSIDWGCSDIVISGSYLFFVLGRKGLFVLNKSDGKEVWNWFARFYKGPIISNGRIIVAREDGISAFKQSSVHADKLSII